MDFWDGCAILFGFSSLHTEHRFKLWNDGPGHTTWGCLQIGTTMGFNPLQVGKQTKPYNFGHIFCYNWNCTSKSAVFEYFCRAFQINLGKVSTHFCWSWGQLIVVFGALAMSDQQVGRSGPEACPMSLAPVVSDEFHWNWMQMLSPGTDDFVEFEKCEKRV